MAGGINRDSRYPHDQAKDATVRKDMRAVRRFDGVIYVTMITRGNPETGQCLVKHAGRVKTVPVKDLIKI